MIFPCAVGPIIRREESLRPQNGKIIRERGKNIFSSTRDFYLQRFRAGKSGSKQPTSAALCLLGRAANIFVDRRRRSGVLDVRSFRGADCDTDHSLVMAKVRKRLAVSKQTTHRFHAERFSLKKLNEVKGKEQYRVKTADRFAALENIDVEVDINRARKLLEKTYKFEPK
jgi:hypothetical protein